MEAASGSIVAYIDDDAYPDRDWLTYLVQAFEKGGFAAIGGPNVSPEGDGFTADCVARAPGGPSHILLNDRTAEHIPGCNMAFRRSCLDTIGGFDPQFRKAGDDVDVCWRILEQGWQIGFSPAALVWHHSRRSVRAYWKQQSGYGEAEALLEPKWPDKYNELGHAKWLGKVYSLGLPRPLSFRKTRVYHGVWGTAPFQHLHRPQPGPLLSLLLAPEFHLATLLLASLSVLGIWWRPLLLCVPLLAMAIGLTALQALLGARQAVEATSRAKGWKRGCEMLVTAGLHALHPLARLTGRLRFGLTPWRLRGGRRSGFSPFPFSLARWTESWKDPARRLEDVEGYLRDRGALVWRGGSFDRFDIQVSCGLAGKARCLMICEDQGSGTQLLRFRAWPLSSLPTIGAMLSLFALGGLAIFDGAVVSGAVLWGMGVLLGALRYVCLGSAMSLLREAGRHEVETAD